MRTEVEDELPACPVSGTDGAGTNPGPLLAPCSLGRGSLPKPFASQLTSGQDSGLHWKLVILPAIAADFV